MAPVNGLNGESEWCEWTTAGQVKYTSLLNEGSQYTTIFYGDVST